MENEPASTQEAARSCLAQIILFPIRLAIVALLVYTISFPMSGGSIRDSVQGCIDHMKGFIEFVTPGGNSEEYFKEVREKAAEARRRADAAQ